MIKSFASKTAEKIYLSVPLTKKERKSLGNLDVDKATARLILLHNATEKQLLTAPALHYHKLHGTNRYSIDANSRNSPWRITFSWENDELTNVTLVNLEDTHS